MSNAIILGDLDEASAEAVLYLSLDALEGVAKALGPDDMAAKEMHEAIALRRHDEQDANHD